MTGRGRGKDGGGGAGRTGEEAREGRGRRRGAIGGVGSLPPTPHLTSPLKEAFEKVLSGGSRPRADQIGQRSSSRRFPDFFKDL